MTPYLTLATLLIVVVPRTRATTTHPGGCGNSASRHVENKHIFGKNFCKINASFVVNIHRIMMGSKMEKVQLLVLKSD